MLGKAGMRVGLRVAIPLTMHNHLTGTSASKGGAGRVVLADDDPTLRRLFTTVLERRGYEVLTPLCQRE